MSTLYTMVAPCFFGTESTLNFEVKRLGAQNIQVTDGRVAFQGGADIIAAAGGAIGMGMAISKSAEGIARQPEAEGKIRTTMMLGLVFLETAIIYALLVVILIIFVL